MCVFRQVLLCCVYAFISILAFAAVDCQSYYKDSDLPTYADHPCIRPCHADRQRVCRYDFHIEYYYTLTSACYDCPINVTDCYRPGCVPADGVRRGILTVNRMLPGPAIHVCKGDEIVVDVHNTLVSEAGVTIHWHGITQNSSPHMDGVPMITQCPVPSFTTFQYRFQAGNVGTHFWHSHAGLQRVDGLAGPLIVRAPLDEDPHRKIYDEDLPEHVMFLQDWYQQMSTDMLILSYTFGYVPPNSILINGKGRSMSPEENKAQTPMTVYHVTKGKKYRFRAINNGIVYCALRLSIQGHSMTMIASDGNDFEPVEVEAFTLFSGERYDFILHANQPTGDYIVTARGDPICKDILTQTAILRYDVERAEDSSNIFVADAQNVERQGKVLTSLTSSTEENYIHLRELKSLSVDNDLHMGKPDKKFYISLSSFHSEPMPYFQLNKITNVVPPSPLLSQPCDVDKDLFCNIDSLGDRNCSSDMCRCIHRIKADIGDLVEIIMIGMSNHIYHPMHLHGYHFWVLALEKFSRPKTFEEVKQMDEEGKLTRNFTGNLQKDAIIVPGPGYTIIRFLADNPGFWFFHCHFEFHTVIGMTMIIQVGDTDQHPNPPKNFPRCGHWKPEDRTTKSRDVKPGSRDVKEHRSYDIRNPSGANNRISSHNHVVHDEENINSSNEPMNVDHYRDNEGKLISNNDQTNISDQRKPISENTKLTFLSSLHQKPTGDPTKNNA